MLSCVYQFLWLQSIACAESSFLIDACSVNWLVTADSTQPRKYSVVASPFFFTRGWALSTRLAELTRRLTLTLSCFLSLQVLPRTVVLSGFKTLHKGLGICMTCGSTKVVRFMHALLSRLMSMFPTEPGELALHPGPA